MNITPDSKLIPFLREMLKWANARSNAMRSAKSRNGRRYRYWAGFMWHHSHKSTKLARFVTADDWDALRAVARKDRV